MFYVTFTLLVLYGTRALPMRGFKSHLGGKIHHLTCQSPGGKGKRDKVAGDLYSRIYYKIFGNREAKVTKRFRQNVPNQS